MATKRAPATVMPEIPIIVLHEDNTLHCTSLDAKYYFDEATKKIKTLKFREDSNGVFCFNFEEKDRTLIAGEIKKYKVGKGQEIIDYYAKQAKDQG